MNVAIPRVGPAVDRTSSELITSAAHQNTFPHEVIKHHHLARRDTRRPRGRIQVDQSTSVRGGGGGGGVTWGEYRLWGWLLMHRTLDPAAAWSDIGLQKCTMTAVKSISVRLSACLSVRLGKAVSPSDVGLTCNHAKACIWTFSSEILVWLTCVCFVLWIIACCLHLKQTLSCGVFKVVHSK